MKKINVLMVTTTFGEGSGVNSFIMNYFRGLDHDRVHVDVLTYKVSPTSDSVYRAEIEKSGGQVFLLPNIKSISKHIKAIKKILQEGRYDVVHDNTLIMTIPLMNICRTMKIKVRILHSHATKLGETDFKIIRNRIFLPLLFKDCNSFFACSNAAGNNMFGKKDFTVLPNVIDANFFAFSKQKRNDFRQSNHVNDKIIILSVGRLCEQKNPIFALKVMKRLIRNNNKVIYWWVGDGPLISEVKEEVKRLGMDKNVVFWGKRSNVRDFYQASDIFFLPSLFEGLPLTGVESQAMGLPAVVADTITKEMVFTDLVRYVSLQAPIDDWVEALEEQIQRIPERRSYQDELRSSQFSSEGAGQRLTNIYEKMLRQKENE